MALFRYEGQEVELVDSGKVLLVERGWAEDRHPSKRNASMWNGSEQEWALIMISLKRAGIVVGWDRYLTVTAEDYELIPDPEPEDAGVDPTPLPGEDNPADPVPTAVGG